MKTTRRDLGTAVVAAALSTYAEAQEPDLAKVVRDANQRNSETLGKFEIPLSTEPAFRFEA
jgi:hypothetical protein